MIHCPDWKALLQHRFDPSLAEPEDWSQALEHLGGCDSCRLEAYEADPSLLFLDLPEIEVDDAEVRHMQQAVATLRQGLELASRDSSQEPGLPASRWLPARRSWGKIAASVVVTGGLVAGLVGVFDSERVAAPEREAVAVGAELGSVPILETDAVPSRGPNRFPAMPSALPANWRDAPVVEEVGGPLTRIYNYPTAPDDKIALVMVIDPALDV